VKRFITSAEWDWPENIFHLVLARPWASRARRPGTKGLSLFLVSKHHVDLETGELGARNGVVVTGVEKKMGLKVSTTCEVTFGETEPAVGTLVGDVHNGIAQMFEVIENARMFVGAKAISTLSTGYLNALEYAKQRVQGADMTRMTDKTAPRVPIVAHPDVRLMLMRQKAWAEGLRASSSTPPSQQDRVELTTAEGEVDDLAVRLNDLLLPVVKGYGSRRPTSCSPPRCRCSAARASPRTTRSSSTSATRRSTPCTRAPRRSRAWTSSSARSSATRGTALGKLLGDVQETTKAEADDALVREKELLARALEDVQAMNGHLVGRLMASLETPEAVYEVGLGTTRLLMSVGDLVVAWLLLRQAGVALAALPTASPRDRAFYEGKVAAARWFAATVLPELSARLAVTQATDASLMQLDEAAF
jgi:hypothetical protein